MPNLFRSKKGFIFTLDIILGMIIVFIIILSTLFFISRSVESSLEKYQLLILGSDIVNVLDQQKKFDSLDDTVIETEMEELLPPNYEMLIRLEGNFSIGNGTLEIGGNLPSEENLLFGRNILITENNTFLEVTYVLWLREG